MDRHRPAAVAATAATATTIATVATAATMPATAPAQRAYSRQDLQRDLDAITATGVPGVLAEVRTGGRKLRGISGVANLGSRKPVNENGYFRIGSNTKTFISVVVLQLAAEHLLNAALAHQPYFAPGTGWHYSNTNYVLLGMVIGKVTRDSWEDQVTRRIVKPLGLHHTFAPGTSTALPRPHATGYLNFDKNTRVDTTAENMSWADSVPATGGDSATVPGSRYGLGIFNIPLSCGGSYWSHEGDVPGYNTIGAVSSDGHTTVVLSINSNVDDPVLTSEYALVDHVMCAH